VLELKLLQELLSVPDRVRRCLSYDPVRGKSRLPGPLTVQVQTVDQCNGSCIMCPYGASGRSGPPNTMDERLYVRLLEQARRAGTTRRLALMLQNEPLLDESLAKRARQAKAILGPRCHVSTVTNGSLLTSDRADELAASGMDAIEVSVDAYRLETFERIRPGLDFETVVRNTQALLARPRRPSVAVRFLRQRDNAVEETQFVRYWKSHGGEVHLMMLSNRAGDVHAYDSIRMPNPRTPSGHLRAMLGRFVPRCLSPFAAVTVLWDGRVLLCCHDWRPRDIVGDLTQQSLADVWNGEAMNHYRRLLWTWRTEESRVCRDCSVVRGAAGLQD